MTSEQKMSRAIDRIQQERAAFFSELDGISQAQLDFRPDPDSWSIGEVAHHIALSETLLLNNVAELLRTAGQAQVAAKTIEFNELPMKPRMFPEALLRPALIPFSIMSRFVPEALQSFMLANPIVKVKTAPAVGPQAGVPRAELLAFLRQVRDSTLQLLEPVKSRDLSRLRWQHPLLGNHNVYGTLEFLASHDRRHRTQMERIKRNEDFPSR